MNNGARVAVGKFRLQWMPAVALLGAFLVHTSVNAIPIGDFNWAEHTPAECDAGLCGPLFFVDNFSTEDFSLGLLGDAFFGVTVNLDTDSGATSLDLGDILPGGSGQSIDDLFGAIINSASLKLVFGSPALPGSIQFLDEAGAVVAALTGPGSLLIDYVAPIEPPTQVPEPSTLLLAVGGMLMLVHRRRQKPQSGIDAKDRDQAPAA